MTLLLFVLVAAAEARRTLVIADDPSVATSHSIFLRGLATRGHLVDIRAANDASLRIRDWDEWLYEAIIVFAVFGDRQVRGRFRATI